MSYFRDNQSKVVLKFDLEYDIKSMKTHPDYTEVSEKEFKEYQKKTDTKKQEN